MADANNQADNSMCDLRLLESGYFADVTVTCGAKSWKLHKAILCLRSRFFEKALTEHYQEAIDGVVNIEEQEPEALDLALTSIYGGAAAVDMGKETADRPVIRLCIDAYRAAKFLDLQSHQLQDIIKQHLGSYLDQKLKWMFTTGNVDQKVKDEDALLWISDLVNGIGEAYKWNVGTIQVMMIEFVWAGRQLFLSRGWIGIKGRLDKVPGFIDDMLQRCALSRWRTHAVWAPRNTAIDPHGGRQCARCRRKLPRKPAEDQEFIGWLSDPFSLCAENSVRRRWCPSCAALDVIPWRTNDGKIQ